MSKKAGLFATDQVRTRTSVLQGDMPELLQRCQVASQNPSVPRLRPYHRTTWLLHLHANARAARRALYMTQPQLALRCMRLAKTGNTLTPFHR